MSTDELLYLEVERIEPYARDPRHTENPEYAQIEASIRIDGMLQPLVVCRPPGREQFVVGAGGNTRLRIVQELFKETGDARFKTVPCRVVPWKGDADVLLAHLKENDLRGGLAFIDRARALMEVSELIEADTGETELSSRALAKVLSERGYTVSHASIAQMRYAVGALLERIPLALAAGLGQRKVQRIHLLETAAGKLWEAHLADDEPFDEIFTQLCRRHDGPEWDLDPLRRALELEIAERAEIPVQTISLALGALIDGRDLEPSPITTDEKGNGTGFDSEIREVTPQSESPRSTDEEPPPSEKRREPVSPQAAPATPGLDPEPERPAEPRPGGTEASPRPRDTENEASFPTAARDATTRPSDLKSLRARAWTLAARLAQRNGFGELIEVLSGQGLGYLVTDVPAPALAHDLDEDALAQVSMLWWQLAACAEVTVAPVAFITPHLAPDSVLRQALEDQDAALLFESVWTLDPGHTGYRLWRRLDDRDWQDYLALLATYRDVRRLAAETGTALWA